MRLPEVALIWALCSSGVVAHPGGLNQSGCHNNTSSGVYHCHSQSEEGGESERLPLADLEGRVIAVTDGDTIKVLNKANQSIKIRLAGIDAPERNQAFGGRSREHLEALVAGKTVTVESIKHDRYGRILGKVWVQPADCSSCGRTLDVNHAQVLDGMAWWYRYYAKDQSDEDRGRYESAESEAKARRWGLWVDPSPVPPWDWRRRK